MKKKERYLIGVFLSVGIGAMLYIIFNKSIFLALGLLCQILFIIKLCRIKWKSFFKNLFAAFVFDVVWEKHKKKWQL